MTKLRRKQATLLQVQAGKLTQQHMQKTMLKIHNSIMEMYLQEMLA